MDPDEKTYCGVLGLIAVVAIYFLLALPRPTAEERYQARVQAWINLPRSIVGDFPKRNDPVSAPWLERKR